MSRMPVAAVQVTEEDVAGRLRIVVNRLQRRLRQESLGRPLAGAGLGARRGGPPRQPHPGRAGRIEQVQPPTMTRIVASLTEAGMVTRVADPTDRRSARVRITPAGERALERIRTRKNAFLLAPPGASSLPRSRPARPHLVDLLEHLLVEP